MVCHAYVSTLSEDLRPALAKVGMPRRNPSGDGADALAVVGSNLCRARPMPARLFCACLLALVHTMVVR
jgi:hypothetical protein